VGNAALVDVPARSELLPDSSSQLIAVVVDGLVRTYLRSANGRQVTVRYSRDGALLGVPSLFSAVAPGIAVQSLTDSRVMMLRPATMRRLASTDVVLANVLLEELAERANAYMEALAATTLSSVRQNLVRHLLDVAAESGNGPPLVAQLTHQELAGHVGTVREVVGRILRELREQGLVNTGRDEITLLDPVQLHALTWPRTFSA
jgi:CRP/FNR family transcriptional regulator, cyclic AMP receptor protein